MMYQQAPVDGWFTPVHQSLAQPLLTGGVPSGFFIITMLGTLLLAMAWWPIILVQVGLYGLAKRLTVWEPQWSAILLLHLTYAKHYR